MEQTTKQLELLPAYICLDVLDVLLDLRNRRYWQELQEAKRRRQQLADDIREAVEEEQRA